MAVKMSFEKAREILEREGQTEEELLHNIGKVLDYVDDMIDQNDEEKVSFVDYVILSAGFGSWFR